VFIRNVGELSVDCSAPYPGGGDGAVATAESPWSHGVTARTAEPWPSPRRRAHTAPAHGPLSATSILSRAKVLTLPLAPKRMFSKRRQMWTRRFASTGLQLCVGGATARPSTTSRAHRASVTVDAWTHSCTPIHGDRVRGH
jgi:hypothetical protein